jgi:hypothetical protein
MDKKFYKFLSWIESNKKFSLSLMVSTNKLEHFCLKNLFSNVNSLPRAKRKRVTKKIKFYEFSAGLNVIKPFFCIIEAPDK